MSNKNNTNMISIHTEKKFEFIEEYIKAWVQKLLQTEECHTLVFIDCMCNNGIYTLKHDRDQIIEGTPLRVAKVLSDAAKTYVDKKIEIYFNDISERKILELKKHLPNDTRNFQIITSVQDGNELLRNIGPQFEHRKFLHYFLLYDPYDASIDWNAISPFFKNWGEVVVNHMISDSIRAIKQVKTHDAQMKYERTYQEALPELLAFGPDRSSYEKRVEQIIAFLKGTREYYIATFPFFNSKNALVYDLICCTGHIEGFKLFKSTAWKVFDGYSSLKRNSNVNQMVLNFGDVNTNCKTEEDDSCYSIFNIADYIQNLFRGQKDVPLKVIWKSLDSHPIFPSDGFRREIKDALKEYYKDKIAKQTISFTNK